MTCSVSLTPLQAALEFERARVGVALGLAVALGLVGTLPRRAMCLGCENDMCASGWGLGTPQHHPRPLLIEIRMAKYSNGQAAGVGLDSR